MTCKDVGSSNADIAGLGIIVSFAIQGGLSFILSAWFALLEFRYFIARPRVARDEQQRNGSDDRVRDLFRMFWMIEIHNRRDPIDYMSPRRELKKILIKDILKNVSDAQLLNGISLLIGALVQRNDLSLYHYHVVYDTLNFTGVSAAAAAVIVFKTPNTILHTLLLGTMFGYLYLAYVIIFGLRLQKWDADGPGMCYHAEGISLANSAHPYVDNIYLALTALYLFAVLATCLGPARESILRGLSENGITEKKGPGVLRVVYICLLSSGGGTAEIILVQMLTTFEQAVTAFQERITGPLSIPSNATTMLVLKNFRWLRGQMRKLFSTPAGSSPWVGEQIMDSAGQGVLMFAIVQYPVHGYTLFALRSSNEPYLSGDSENAWGFGQVVALVLVASTVMDCLRALFSYNIMVQIYDSAAEKSADYQHTISILKLLLVKEDLTWPRHDCSRGTQTSQISPVDEDIPLESMEA